MFGANQLEGLLSLLGARMLNMNTNAEALSEHVCPAKLSPWFQQQHLQGDCS